MARWRSGSTRGLRLVAAAVAGLLVLVAAARLAAPPAADPPAVLVRPGAGRGGRLPGRLRPRRRGRRRGAGLAAVPGRVGAPRGVGRRARRPPLGRAAPWTSATSAASGSDGGFAQLLYAARATAPDGRPALSAWRADADPAGRVVWLELVWLFSDEVGAVAPVGATDDDRDLPPPLDPASRRAVVLVGVRSVGGREGYYALGRPAAAGPPVPAGFAAVDADGELRPGAWSYGQPAGLVEYGARSPRVEIDLAPDLAALRGAYLRTLP